MAKIQYWRITIKSGSKCRRFWARDRKRKGQMTLYTPLDKEGDDLSHYRGKTLVIRKELVENKLIVKEQPAIMDRKYAVLKVIR